MDLVYYTPFSLYKSLPPNFGGIERSFSSMFNPSISLMDRSGATSIPPIPYRNLFPFLQWSNAASFESICIRKFDRILRDVIQNKKKLVIFYSGGIDSTLIACLAISHPKFSLWKNSIILALTEESIRENPTFWNDTLRTCFGDRIVSASRFGQLISDDQNVCLTGEFADNIFGSLTLKSYIDFSGIDNSIEQPFASTGLEWMLDKIPNQGDRDQCKNMVESILKTSPRDLQSNHDCFWWLNFVLKWQAVRFRLVSHARTPEMVNAMASRVMHFFDDDEFQNWAVMTSEQKVHDSWASYKLPAKSLIYKINRDRDYFLYKTKYPSIPGLTRYANMHDFIYLDEATNAYTARKTLLDAQR